MDDVLISAIFQNRPMHTIRTGRDTLQTPYAQGLVEYQLASFRQGFRIVAPSAMQWTAFEENHGPDTWAVVKRKALDIEYCRLNISS